MEVTIRSSFGASIKELFSILFFWVVWIGLILFGAIVLGLAENTGVQEVGGGIALFGFAITYHSYQIKD